MYCEMCGAVNDDNAKKCKKCGFSFTGSMEETKDEFESNVDKFKEENYETIRKKSVTEKATNEVKKMAKSTTGNVKKLPLPVKIVACLGIVGVIAFGIYYYIQTNNFFVPEKNNKTGETRYVYYKSGYKVLDAPLFLRGKNYRVDMDGYRLEDEIYVDYEGNSYYYGQDGVMKENEWFVLDGQKKFADKKGIILKNQWKNEYYLDNDGNITYNKVIGDYYVGDDGKYIKNKWQDDHFYGAEGKMLRSTRSTDEKQLKLDKDGNIMYDPTIQIRAKDFRFGSTVVFGEMEQDGNEMNGPEPIEWLYLIGDQNESVLLSKNVLFAAPYQVEEYTNEVKNEWGTSRVKNWLNGYFYETVFDDIDEKYILEKENGAVFVPSQHELEMYIPNQRLRISFPTEVAKIASEKSIENKSAAVYWLRDDGVNAMHKAFVTDVGDIITDDISDNIRVSNKITEATIQGHAGTDDVVKNIGNMVFEEALDAILPGWVSKILNASGLTEQIEDLIWSFIGGEQPKEDTKKIIKDWEDKVGPIEDSDKDMSVGDIIKTKMPERVVTNPYKNVGLVTNQFVGVRPMLIVNMQANK